MTNPDPRAGRRFRAAGVLCVAAVLAAFGCSAGQGGKATVSGKVTYRGQPVPGTLILQAPSVGASYPVTYPASIGADGRFDVSGVPAGAYQVGIQPPAAGAARPGGSAPPGAAAAAPHVNIPAKYLNPQTSGLSLDVKGGATTKDFSLSD